MRPGFPHVDPPFPTAAAAVPQQLRALRSRWTGKVVIGYGGNDGDCGTYWGWLVGGPEAGGRTRAPGRLPAGRRRGAIWGAGNGPAVDSSGNIYVATGNGSSGSAYITDR